jgi:D-sedoheptulose 7-phosphate isomerase
MAPLAHAAICIASGDTARIQEGHILCGHMLCDWIELAVSSNGVPAEEPEAQ